MHAVFRRFCFFFNIRHKDTFPFLSFHWELGIKSDKYYISLPNVGGWAGGLSDSVFLFLYISIYIIIIFIIIIIIIIIIFIIIIIIFIIIIIIIFVSCAVFFSIWQSSFLLLCSGNF